jgi:hypothetical protein
VNIFPEVVIQQTAKKFGFSVAELVGNRRFRNLTKARHIAMELCYTMAGYSLPQVGAMFGVHHTSVLNARKRFMASDIGSLKLDIIYAMSALSEEERDAILEARAQPTTEKWL